MKVQEGKPIWKDSFDSKVFSFKIFPGISKEILMHMITSQDCHGLVLEAFGSGTLPSQTDAVTEVLKTAQRLQKPVVIVSQCPHGQVDLDLYAASKEARRYGALSAGDMTREAAVVKLMHALGLGLKVGSLKSYFTKNQCGERSL
jgi:L-asparaginase